MFASSNPPSHHHHHPHHHHPNSHHYSLKLKSMFELAVAQQQYLYPLNSSSSSSSLQNQSQNQPSNNINPVGVVAATSTSSTAMNLSPPLAYPTSPQTPPLQVPENLQKLDRQQSSSPTHSTSSSSGPFHFSQQHHLSQQPQHFQSVSRSAKNSKAPAAFSIESLLAHSNNWRRQTEDNPSSTKNLKDSRYSPYPHHPSSVASAAQTSSSSSVQKCNSSKPDSSEKGQQQQKGTENNTSLKGSSSSSTAANSNARRAAKSKRVRTIFTPEQLERLEAEFERQQYMVGPERLYLASSLYLTEAQVKVWFQNRRIKWRKQHLEMEQQRLAIYRTLAEQDMLASSGSTSAPHDDLLDEDTSSSRGTADMESVVGDEDDSHHSQGDFTEDNNSTTESLLKTPPNQLRLRTPLHLNNPEDYSASGEENSEQYSTSSFPLGKK